jgi:hypothetical protein
MAQTGTTPITMNGNGQYILPDGSVWINTDAVYAGANQTGPLEGFIYYGSNGSQWFAGASHASTPESMSQYQQNMDQLTAQVTKISCGGSGG